MKLLKHALLVATGAIAALILAATITFAAAGTIRSAAFNDVRVIFNGNELDLAMPLISVITEENPHLMSNYMPVRVVLEALGYNVDWDAQARAVPVTAAQDVPDYITIQGERFSTALTTLSLNMRGLTNADIEPLRYMTNLTVLSLNDNQISNPTPLAGLTNLTSLNLGLNRISDLTPLAGLTNLTWLELSGNQIRNLIPLAGLTNLTWLRLANNQISNLTPLAGLTNLTWLELSGNQISTLTPLAGLTNLTELRLHGNQITDWSPVAHVATVHGRP